MIARREFNALLGGAAVAWPLAGRAQQTKVYRIGALLVGNADVDSFRTELREELRRYRYVEGQKSYLRISAGAWRTRSR
jgi:putative tryptophan/tyrosine transport system substrate-binding protein